METKSEHWPLLTFKEYEIQLYARDQQHCQCCKKVVGEFDWHADHVVPWIRGGKTILENGQVLCVKCNLKSASHRPVQHWPLAGGPKINLAPS